MSEIKTPAEQTKKPQEQYYFKKRLGSTTFHVAVHFNPAAKETAEDKIIRLIKSETELGKAANL